MLQETEVQKSLYRARLLLEEGQDDLVLAGLEGIDTDDEEEQREIAYLIGWYYTRRRRWDDASRYLLPLCNAKQLEEDLHAASGTGFERRARYLIQLGDVAVNLSHYEDAAQHYVQCLKLIERKRLALPKVELRARYGLAMTYYVTGFYTAALQHYEEALLLCEGHEEIEDLPHIYYGLCDTYRLLGQFGNAYDLGKKALELYVRRSDELLEGRMRNLLGHICYQLGSFRDASDYYTESLAIASSHGRFGMMMLNFTALAELRLAEGHLDEAKRYCQRARDLSDRVADGHLTGVTYLDSGKVAQAEAEQAEGEQRQDLLEEAMRYFEKAEKLLSATQARTAISELYGRWAEVLEALGRTREALAYWKSAYEALPLSQNRES